MKIGLSLGIPSCVEDAEEKEILLDIGDRRDVGSLLFEFRDKARAVIPDLVLLEFGINIDVSNILTEERFGHRHAGYLRMEVQWPEKTRAKISLLQFGGMQISDEEAAKIFGKIVPPDNVKFEKNELGDRIVLLDTTFEKIRLSGHASDCVCFVKRNKDVNGESDVIVRMKDRHNNGNAIFHVDISDLNGTFDGRRLAEYFANLGPNYVVWYYNLSYGDARWRRIKEKRINIVKKALSFLHKKDQT